MSDKVKVAIWNYFPVAVPCHTASFSDQGDAALDRHLIFPQFALDSWALVPKYDATTQGQGRIERRNSRQE